MVLDEIHDGMMNDSQMMADATDESREKWWGDARVGCVWA